MAFITVEDLLGTVEVVIFPQSYEKSQQYLQETAKYFMRGRVSEEDDNASKLICEEVIPFEHDEKRTVDPVYRQTELPSRMSRICSGCSQESDGKDRLIIYCKAERAVKRLRQTQISR